MIVKRVHKTVQTVLRDDVFGFPAYFRRQAFGLNVFFFFYIVHSSTVHHYDRKFKMHTIHK